MTRCTSWDTAKTSKVTFLKGEIEQIKRRRRRRMTGEMNDRMDSSVSSTEGKTDGRTEAKERKVWKLQSIKVKQETAQEIKLHFKVMRSSFKQLSHVKAARRCDVTWMWWSCRFSLCVLFVFPGFCFLVVLTGLILPPHLSWICLISSVLLPDFWVGDPDGCLQRFLFSSRVSSSCTSSSR